MSYKVVLFDAGQTLWHWDCDPALTYLQRDAYDPAPVLLQAIRDAGGEVDAHALRSCFDRLQLIYGPKWEAFETNGRGITDAEVKAHFDQLDADLLRMLQILDPNGTVIAAIRDAFAQWQPTLFPEVREVLDRLRANGVDMAIVSNGYQQMEVAERLDIASMFGAIVGSLYVGCRKPQPEIFALALSALGRSPTEVVHVGDSYNDDMIGARNAGIEPILIDRAGTTAWGDVRIIHSLKELPALVI